MGYIPGKSSFEAIKRLTTNSVLGAVAIDCKDQNHYPMNADVTLQFRSPDDLWAFRIEALIDFIKMNKDMNLLTCLCTPQQVQLAVAKYGASVVLNRDADSNR